ncbi:tetratricopeptide repeat protein [Brevundimonas sp.]|jgi:tetratricopeptide (TPR) repeat protein|uniref:tetratricopeptide repeat protein n=1 Tax=Brevundimonas sp. TaxID=1871086 RepID=UPI002E0F9518|nr:tetratricopeptide repeat protein [Brevundimonas sp.]
MTAPNASQDVTDQPLVHAPAPVAQGTAGDSASAEAIRRLSRTLAGGGALKKQKRLMDLLKGAVAAMRMRDFDAGANRALEALKIDETSGLAWHVLAICQEKVGRFVEAIQAYEAALALLPEDPAIAHDLSRLAQRLGHLEIAEKLLQKFLAAEPGHIDGTNNLACVLREQNRYDEAIDLLRGMIQIEPASALLWNTLGTVLSDQGRMAESLPFFEEALRLEPDLAKARYNRANARQPLGDLAGALEDFDAALEGAEPGYEAAMMRMARAMTLMGVGRIPEGFHEYEVRLDPDMPDAMQVVTGSPRRTDEPLAGRSLLIVGEQGLADEMVFGGCVGDAIKAVGPDGWVHVAVEPRLVTLFQRSFPTACVVGHRTVRINGRLHRIIPDVDDRTESERPIDFWTPMATLLADFRPSVDAFPDRAGYLTPDPERVARWKAELAALGDGLKVGLHWKSLILSGSRGRYFSSFDRWRPVLETPGTVMVNLQCGDVADDLAQAEAAGVRIWTPPFDLKDDLEDLAAMSCALDLVIGPGIAGTNIAAAVGARTWMLTAPDDWHTLNTDRYPFYPHTRLFKRSFDGWPQSIAEVRSALDRAVAGDWNAA